jgi:acyl-CoA reductase-like NAD-dependent aldehyde dehydrogenase
MAMQCTQCAATLRADRREEHPHKMQLARDETFGPLAAIFRFRSDDEVIALANVCMGGI